MASPDFIPDSEFSPDQETPQTVNQSEADSPSFIPDNQFISDEDKYGTTGQQALTLGEGLAKGFGTNVLTAAAEKGLSALGVPGLSPKEQELREQTNPVESGLSEAAGLGIGAFTGTGEARLLEEAGQGALKLAGVVSKPTTIVAKAAGSLLKNGIESALYGADTAAAKLVNDPTYTAGSALAHIGLYGAIGAGAGALLGPLLPVWAKDHAADVEQGINGFKDALESESVPGLQDQVPELEKEGFLSELSKQKDNAPQLNDIAVRNNWPTAEGITSGSKIIQKAEDTLLNGPPTIASLSRQKIYNEIYDTVSSDVQKATASEVAPLSETEVGEKLQNSLKDKLEAENAPIKELYRSLEGNLQEIPLSDSAMRPIKSQLNEQLEGLVPGTGRHNYLKSVVDRLDWVDDLSKLKMFRTEASKSAGFDSKDLAQSVSNVLNGVEERAVRRYANTQSDPTVLNGLLDQISDAKSQYKEFITKLKTLGESMGKKNVRGPQDFINFIDNMNPQTLTRRLFNENNTKFAEYFAKEFPEEMQIMRDYQRGQINSKAMKDGLFQAKDAIRSVVGLGKTEGLEPEMQRILYNPEELQKLKDAKEYIGNFPPSFNPSGTAHESAFRSFFEHPTGAVLANLRDYAIQGFIKTLGKANPIAEKEAESLLPLLGSAVSKSTETNPGAFKNSVDYLVSALKGEKTMDRLAKGVFTSSLPLISDIIPDDDRLDKLDKKLMKVNTADPNSNEREYASIGGNMNHYIMDHGNSYKALVTNAANYANSMRPSTSKNSPLDKEIPPSKGQKAAYNRLLAIADNPASVLAYLKTGQLTSTDMANLKAMNPAWYDNMSKKLSSEMTNHLAKGESIPYKIRLGVSTFLGQPLDSTMKPQAVQSIMMANSLKGPSQSQGSPQGRPKTPKATSTAMAKVNSMYATPNQARAAHRTTNGS